MTSTSSAVRLRVASVDDLLGVVPSLLHFHPSESLVVILVQSGRLEVAARADLADLPDRSQLEAAFGPLLDRFPCADVFAIAYTADIDLAWRMLGDVESFAPRSRFRLHADGERWFDDPDGPGHPYDPAGTAVAAAATFAGIEVRATRSAMAESLSGTFGPGERAAALAAVRRRTRDGDDLLAAAARVCGLFADTRFEGRACLSLEDRVTLAAAAQDADVVEGRILALSRQNAESEAALWAQVVQGAPEELQGGPLTVLALAAWVHGNGALTRVCLQRLTALGHDDPWIEFVALACGQAIHPDCWDAIRADFLALPEPLTHRAGKS